MEVKGRSPLRWVRDEELRRKDKEIRIDIYDYDHGIHDVHLMGWDAYKTRLGITGRMPCTAVTCAILAAFGCIWLHEAAHLAWNRTGFNNWSTFDCIQGEVNCIYDII